MRIVTCGLIVGAALLGPAPLAMADTPVSTANAIPRSSFLMARVPPAADVTMTPALP